ncbi:glycosyltransferase [Paenibacillus spongiae]|uniref:Glycosyltransferase n=1 Tax=Paenibacillus spongiae TaxID=2909671 RepID=A0ABY5S706_9BACL|nr:glycosyltransferase [Paenibacillus spongiae]UVI28632.1 glycosyltransferase [Paenibacillus spongiae]
MNNVFANFDNQKVKKKELIVILNRDDMNIRRWRRKARRYKNVHIYRVAEEHNIGKCLNYGVGKANFDIIAKFDDDNYYGPGYLREALDAFKNKPKASVVGKYSAYVYFEETEALMIYRGGGENRYKRRVKGGTFVFRRSVWNKIKFNEQLRQNSDVDFLNRCRANKFKIYSVSKYNYVCIRRADTNSHTQKLSTQDYMAKCKLVAYTKDVLPIITKKLSR